MRKNTWLPIGLGLALCVSVALAVLAWWPTPGVNKRNFDRIEIGMTRAEAEAILGPPYDSNRYRGDIWFDENADAYHIRFGEDYRVESKSCAGWTDDRTAWQKLLDRLPWLAAERDDILRRKRAIMLAI